MMLLLGTSRDLDTTSVISAQPNTTRRAYRVDLCRMQPEGALSSAAATAEVTAYYLRDKILCLTEERLGEAVG